MKKLAKKSFLQKTIIVVLMVLCINFIVPTYSHADFGGVLFDPIADVLCSIGDAVIYLIEGAMTGTWGDDVSLGDGGFLVKDSDFWGNSKYSEMQESGSGSDVDPDKEFSKGWLGLDNSYYLPVTTYSPEQIFAGKVSGLDINFISPKYTEAEGGSAAKLQPTIASWYVALRNLSVVGLLSVLVYVGIRIIISSTASDKAKYKQLLVDWLIALCILFFLHYIMAFTVTMVDSICTAIGGTGSESVSIATTDGTLKTNLLGAARFKTQYKDFGDKVTYLIAYLALVVYTVIFTWFYLKRLLMMAFLTLIAPLVALTYPIDKIQDGKAQAFNSWLKEYVFNALIQPFHLIIYMVFVGAAMDLAQTNIIYMIAALGFILPAEKILRSFFGFNKAGATLGGIVGGAAIGSFLGKGVKSLAGGGGSKGGSKGQGGNTKQVEASKGVRYQKSNGGLSGLNLEHQIGPGSELPKSPRQNTGFEEGPKTPNLLSDAEKAEYTKLGAQLDNMEEAGAAWAGYEQSQAYADAQRRYKELEDKKNGKQEENIKPSVEEAKQEEQNAADKIDRSKFADSKLGKGLGNLAKYHTYGRGARFAKGAGKAIKGAAKFATRTTFKAAAGVALGAIPAAVAMASGGGLAGGAAAFATAGAVGTRIGGAAADGLIGAVGSIPGAYRKNRDIFNGNNNLQKAHDVKQQMRDENNIEYVKAMMEKEGWRDENGNVHEAGEIASRKDVNHRMSRYAGYFKEGLDIDTATKAQATADKYNLDDESMAKIAGDAKNSEITKKTFKDQKQLQAEWNDEYRHNVNAGKSAQVAEKATDAKFAILADMYDTSYAPKNANNVVRPKVERPVAPTMKQIPKQETAASRTIKTAGKTVRTVGGAVSRVVSNEGQPVRGRTMQLEPGTQNSATNPAHRPNPGRPRRGRKRKLL